MHKTLIKLFNNSFTQLLIDKKNSENMYFIRYYYQLFPYSFSHTKKIIILFSVKLSSCGVC